MSEESSQQQEHQEVVTVCLEDDTANEVNVEEVLDMDNGPPAETCTSRGELADTAFGVNLEVPYMDDVDEPSAESSTSSEEPSAESSTSSEEPSAETSSEELAGETRVEWWNVCLTIAGFLFYILDLVTDIGTAIYYASNGHWWQATVTITIVYAAVIIHAGWKWSDRDIHCTGAAAWLRYVASLLVNWPDVKQYGALCLLEWKLHKSPGSSAHLVPEWHKRRVSVALLKVTEGVCEACPQAILQLYLLLPDLYGASTWTDYLRIAGAFVSLCTAGATLVNMEKCNRIIKYTDMPLSELIVLHVWAVPVTVSRLLSVALVLSVHSYWILADVALHLAVSGVCWCRTEEDSCTLGDVIAMCQAILHLIMSPVVVTGSVTFRRVLHAIYFLVNTAETVVWALETPLVCAHPYLYAAIICFNAVMFAVGVVGMELHARYWPHSYEISL